ncbi:MAG TPA: S8 family serine peptidase [Usitatibacter sp.]|nr:S8 family serine peptidase [Usitatibacter sp.]
MQLKALSAAVAAAVAAISVQAGETAVAQAAPFVQAEKKIITSADQLPRRQYTIARLPSELIDAPASEIDAVAAAMDKDLAQDLATLDIQDRATRTGMMMARAQFAIHRGDFAAAQSILREVRSQQEKAADKLTSGTSMENILAARMRGGSLEQQRAQVRESLAQAYGAMPWDVVGTNLKSAKGGLELMSKPVMIGSVRTNLDPAAKNLNLNVPGQLVVTIVAIRNNLEHVLPFRDDIVSVMQNLVDRNQVARVDRWSERQVVLPANAPGKPVVIGIWDSGTDYKLFKATNPPGIAFDRDFKPTDALVRPMGEAEARLPALKQYVKGAMDLQAAIDSPESRALKQRVASLKAEEVKQFSEDLSAMGMWVHGTHVAGIAVEGNPFAQVATVAMHFNHSSVPQLPDDASAARVAAAYKKAVDSFKAAGARVVNMSWRYSPQAYEGALAYHNVGKTPDERKAIANKIFEIEKRALEAAIRGAPEILFVAGSGNENNSADFSQYIPAGFELPNLITAGAVDMSGTETSFSTFGKTVAVHANGFEVVSYIPGGEKLKLSGTSMASPNVANLAGKLFAMKPELTVAQVKELILKGAEKNGRVNLINPKKSLELAGVKLPQA